MPLISYRNLNSPELVKEWRKLVNSNVMMGRDSHLIKERLTYLTPVQILLGMYQYVGNKTITIPRFLKSEEAWLIDDEIEAEIELAVCITHTEPPAYWIWLDTRDEVASNNTSYDVFVQGLSAKKELQEWANSVLDT